MTNDFAVEQQKKPSALPYGVVGAAAGAGGGYLIGKKVGNYKSYDDIIKEVEDTVKFTENTKEGAPNADLWKEVQEKQAKLKELENAATEAAKPQLPETAKERTDYEAAQRKVDDAIKTLQEQANKDAGVTTQRYGKFPTEAVLKAEITDPEEFNLAKKYLDRYNNAKKDIFNAGTDASNLRDKIKSEKTNVENFYKGLAKYNPKLEVQNQYSKNIKAELEKILPKDFASEVKNMDYNKIQQYQSMFGEDIFSISDTYVKNATVAVDKTPGKKVWVTVNDSVVKTKRNDLRQQLIDNITTYIGNDTKLQGYDEKFFTQNKATLEMDLMKPIKDIGGVAGLEGEWKNAKNMLRDIENLEFQLKNGTKSFGVNSTTGVTNRYACGSQWVSSQSELNDLKRKSEILLEMSEKYNKGKAEILGARGSVISQDVRVTSLQRQLRDAVANDPGIQDVLKSIETLNREKAPELDKNVYQKLKSLINMEEVTSGNAREITEADIKKELVETRDRLKGIYEEAAKKSGVVNEEAKKAAEEAAANGKKDLETSVKNLIEKVGKGKIKPWLAAVIGGVALGAIALGIGASRKSKEA